MTVATYADILRPAGRTKSLLYDAALVAGGSLLLALSAQMAVRLRFSPVPITGQTLAVLLAGALLGSRRGALCVLAYLAEGAAGLPFFAGGMAGIAYMLGPTGGYLLGFVVAAYATGFLAERGWDRRCATTALAMLAGNGIIHLFGVVWLSWTFGMTKALAVGLYPFLLGDALKLALAVAVLPAGWSLLGRFDKLR